jgi:hypothetical protein
MLVVAVAENLLGGQMPLAQVVQVAAALVVKALMVVMELLILAAVAAVVEWMVLSATVVTAAPVLSLFATQFKENLNGTFCKSC